MPFDADAWLAEVTEGVELDATTQEALRVVLAQEAVAKRIGDGVLRQSDYSRSMDELSTEREEIQKNYQTMVTSDHNNAALFEKMQEENTRLRTAIGGEAEGIEETEEPSDSISKQLAEMQQKLEAKEAEDAAREGNYVRYLNLTTKLQAQHQRDFGELLDIEQLTELAQKNQISLEAAYDQQTAGARKEKNDRETEEEIQRRVDEQIAAHRHETLVGPTPDFGSQPKALKGLLGDGEPSQESPRDRTARIGAKLAELDAA